MNPPAHNSLPIQQLAACFNNTSATYKFYWFLAILKRVEEGETSIPKNKLFAEMIAHCWYTVNYFHVSFGKQDKLQEAVGKIRNLEKSLTVDAHRNVIYTALINSTNSQTQSILRYFNGEVPHRFLSPWIRASDKVVAYKDSQDYLGNCLYALYDDHITINPVWVSYLQQNVKLLKDFCYWNLALYLQVRNPNVPAIPDKLIRQPGRKALTQQRKLWDVIITELGGVDCIYTNNKLTSAGYAMEHFIPFAFVSHDLMWNLIPASSSFNSKKGDQLPKLEQYFESFYKLQFQAVEVIKHKEPKNKLFEDYLTSFPQIESIPLTQQQLFEQIQPLVTIASNNGFEFMR